MASPALSPPPYRDRRPDALGDLRVLPDETICDILDLLSPRDLARLACVSSVMYILCNEEPLWMRQCLKNGGLLEYRGSWKQTTLYRQNLSAENEDLQKPLHFDGFSSLFLYRRWYRSFTALDVFNVDSGDIERKSNLTPEEFHSKFDGKMPVLLSDLANSWPARTKWTIDQLSLNFGNVAFRISQRSSKKIRMRLKDYVSYMEVQHDEDPLYIFDEKFGEAAPSLLDDYNVPHLFQEDYFDVLDADKRPSFRWLIIGPERSGASWHIDPALTSAWNTLLCGRKRWALYPPGRVPAGVTVHVNEEDGDVNIETPTSLQWWLDIYPNLADHEKPIECTQLPGETIFVPSGWWHCVLNLEKTVAVTQNFVNASNFLFVCLDLAPGHRHKGVSRAGLLAIQDFEASDSFKENLLDEPETSRMVKRQKVAVTRNAPFGYNCNQCDRDVHLLAQSKTENESFSYDIEFLSTFLDEERDHYNSVWTSSNCIGQREMREWLQKLWISKPSIRQLIWRGAEIALDVGKWYHCIVEICTHHDLPLPLDDEKFPVGTGSNPVFLVSDCAIKIYAEGGLNSSIHSLGTELEFQHILQNAKSPLIGNIPNVLASGIIVKEDGFFRVSPWDGKDIPDAVASNNIVPVAGDGNLFPFGLWSKKTIELGSVEGSSGTSMWPYIVTRRCKGDILAKIKDSLSSEDVLELAQFLGDQLCNLHLLPLPQMIPGNHFNVISNFLPTSVNDLIESFMPHFYVVGQVTAEDFKISPDWKLILAALNKKKKNIKKRLTLWGSPIPEHLIEKVEEYIPYDLTMLLDLMKDDDGFYKVSGYPTWIHSDVMEDNIHMEPCSSAHCFVEPSARLIANGEPGDHNGEERTRKWRPTQIIDFGNLSAGDPLLDLIPIYIDVFQGDKLLLKQFLRSYKLPLARQTDHGPLSSSLVENSDKFKRISYRAMCYCILHDDNVLGAVFTLWKELQTASSWEEVEATVWGELNTYQCPC